MENGTKVEWTQITRKGRAVHMNQRYGTVVSVDGDIALIKRQRGKDILIRVSKLHVTGSGPNQLTQFAMSLVNVTSR